MKNTLSPLEFSKTVEAAAAALHDDWRKNRQTSHLLSPSKKERRGIRRGATDVNGSDWAEITPLIASNWNPRPPKAYKEEGGVAKYKAWHKANWS